MRDNLGFIKCDAQTIARLAQSVQQALNATVRGYTPESDHIDRTNQHECMRGLEISGVPLSIIAGVSQALDGVMDLKAIQMISKISIRFGMQLQRAIEANERTSHPDPQPASIQTQKGE